jgi:hypothetical protein
MPRVERASHLPGPLVALLGWLAPGAGYWIIGERARALIIFVSILTIYLIGLLVGGVRVIEVPGYDTKDGTQLRVFGGRRVSPRDREYAHARWIMLDRPHSEIANKPWFAAQVLAGPVSLASAYLSNHFAQQNAAKGHAPLDNIGTLYAAVAGMLNLFVIIDSTFRASQPPVTRKVAA